MTDITKTAIAKLSVENYFTWKYKMELLLIKENLWSVLSETKPKCQDGTNSNIGIVTDWQRRDDQARSVIGLLVEDSQLHLIRTKMSARDTWTALKEYYEKDSLGNKVNLMRRICSSKLNEDGNMEKHICELTDLFQKLVDLSQEQLSEKWTVAMILSSLPRSYDTLVTALEAKPEADLTISLVKSKLIDEYSRRKKNSNQDNGSSGLILKTTQGTLSCFFCKRNGHLKRECEAYKVWKEKRNKEEKSAAKKTVDNDKANKVEQKDEFLFMVSSNSSGDWIIDSGATSHVTSNKNCFVSFEHTDNSSLNVTNGQDINGSLLSVKKLVNKGFTVNFSGDICEIKVGQKQIAVAKANGNLYKLCHSDKISKVTQHKSNCMHHWHRVFGHRDPNAIKQMCTRQAPNETKIFDCELKKSEVEIKIKKYVEMVKNKFSRRPKIIRSDRGGEYVNKAIVEYLKNQGIQVQYTAPYTPQQNGVAE
ncbi:PREDICTED: uncharacterized protein LOC108779224 [Cyphomyrmex costatus]|uniref:uncharacterized protein LOC108779224 n=1 Tax=Cyphomyrmex costatus TaxID=456900 RepID=UPI0008522D2D|nr:PREDICTED: uncharacterized protein LOC108779224 [Cyphomyrmex costatus]